MSYSTLRSWRNRMFANPRVRHGIQKIPFLRRFAQNRATYLFGLMTGFVQSQVLQACVELDLFSRLATRPQTAGSLAGQVDLDAERMELLLDSATDLGLVEQYRDGTFGLGITGLSLMHEPGLQSLVRHHRALYRDLEDPLSLLRDRSEGTHLGKFWPYATGAGSDSLETSSVSAYTAVMGDSQRMIAEQILDAVSLASFSSLLDVGGGNGSFAAAVARAYPNLRPAVFDFPAVLPLASSNLQSQGLAGWVGLYGGNFHSDDLPGAQECISLVRILHDHNDDPAAKLLRSANRALRPGGTILVAEPMKQARGHNSAVGAYFGFYLLAMGSGRPRTPGEIETMLTQAGFGRVRRHRTALPLVCSVISARKN